MTSTEAAAWVQAIGSILAVVAAFLISSRQFHNATYLQGELLSSERKRRSEALMGMISASQEEFINAAKALRSSEPKKWFESNSAIDAMGECCTAFCQVSPLDMPSASAAKALVSLRDKFKTAHWNIQATLEIDPSDHKKFISAVEFIEDNLREVEEERLKLLAEMPAV